LQRRDICPYYKNGFCTSPLLDTPSDSVVSPNRCFKTYKGCRLYQDKGEEREGLLSFQENVELELKFYPRVNILASVVESSCENYRLVRTEKGHVAFCSVLSRVLTVSNAQLCNKYWQTCPIRTS